MQRNPPPPALPGMAHESHLAPVIRGSADQHAAQQEALRSRQGSSRSQTTHGACRTIRAVSRPKMESASSTAHIVVVVRNGERRTDNGQRKETFLSWTESRIVTAMRKFAFAPAILLLTAMPAMAQTSEFGLLIGGSKRLISHSDQAKGLGISDSFKFNNSVREIFYAVQLDPGTYFKIKGGQIEAPVAFQFTNAAGAKARTDVPKGKVEHADAIIHYRFSEPFGSTGLYAGAGLYRQRATLTDSAIPEVQRGNQTETNYGFQGGVTGDFPITRRTGFIAELAYHWINYHYKVRYVTLSGGLRFSF